jgi:hypothetical protein
VQEGTRWVIKKRVHHRYMHPRSWLCAFHSNEINERDWFSIRLRTALASENHSFPSMFSCQCPIQATESYAPIRIFTRLMLTLIVIVHVVHMNWSDSQDLGTINQLTSSNVLSQERTSIAFW